MYNLPSMRPQSCKNKGRRFQQKIAKTILDAFPHLTEDDVRSTSMGAHGEDVQMSPLARNSLPLSLECKCVEKINVWQCIEQANTNCPNDATPCVVFSRNHSSSYAVISWEALLSLYEHANRQTPQGNIPTHLMTLLVEVGKIVEHQNSSERKMECV